MKVSYTRADNQDGLPARDTAYKIAVAIHNKENSNWFGMLRQEIDLESSKPITFAGFAKSIDGVIKAAYHLSDKLNGGPEDIAIFVDMLDNAWQIIKDKWPACFVPESADKYNIRKSVGINPLHTILKICLINSKGEIKPALDLFEAIICRSNVESGSWLSGGTLSAVSVVKGLTEVVDTICNTRVENAMSADKADLLFNTPVYKNSNVFILGTSVGKKHTNPTKDDAEEEIALCKILSKKISECFAMLPEEYQRDVLAKLNKSIDGVKKYE